MSDEYYQRRAARRTRMLALVAIVAAIVVLVLLGLRSLLYDSCTRSYDRSPEAVARAYVAAIRQGNQPAAQRCWQHNSYYSLDAGCSDICLSKVFGAAYDIAGVEAGEPSLTPEGRARLTAAVTITCTGSDASYRGEVVLDSVGSRLPWKHWAIVRSSFGGTIVDPWCK
jgi:hypothetical protein